MVHWVAVWERPPILGHHDGHEGCSQTQVPRKMILLRVFLERRSSAFGQAAFPREVPSYMRFSVSLTWERRWSRMMAVTCATSFAASLLE